VRAGVSHAQEARFGVPLREAFVLELGAVNRLAARAVASGKISALGNVQYWKGDREVPAPYSYCQLVVSVHPRVYLSFAGLPLLT
jgi:hypothetical protein